MSAGPYVPLVEVTRGDVVESVHHGLVVVSDERGTIVDALGDPAQSIVTRSAAKPFQAAQLVASGLADEAGVTDAELAVATGSHGGTPEHVSVVRRLLSRFELEPAHLRCGTHLPFDRAARTLARARQPTVLQNNCSGKHAVMLAGVRHGGRPLDRYLDPADPWHVAIRALLARAAGLDPGDVGTVIDGCGAPSFVLPAAGFARAWARLAAGRTEELARVWRASVSHPRMIAGAGRLETELMESVPGGVLAKSGAEGVWALGVVGPAGARGAVIKIADGDDRRARTAAAIAVAARLTDMDEAEQRALATRFLPPVTTLAGEVVGQVRALVRHGGRDRPPGRKSPA